ncbi:hypothetical protein [Geodermatophilus marinus]|uniref:hypothetical protein n=1 Tax=Geodermatophilus sp. LHW52908 TaxID=2303986 RepID=UPI0011C100B6|nr:hypothetical protein [Geodermatophilus sp. LHW52908]
MAAEDRTRFLRELNGVLELVEAAAGKDPAPWRARLTAVEDAVGGITVEMLWMLSQLCAWHLTGTAAQCGQTLEQALQEARLQALGLVD